MMRQALTKTLLALLMPVVIWGHTALAQEQVAPHDRQMLTFYFHPSPAQDKALDHYAHADLQKAEKAGYPVEARTAMLPGMIIISLESITLCDRVRGCPLLVFRDIAKAPTLQDYSYQNISISQGTKGTFLYLRAEGPDRECLVPLAGRARCSKVKPAASKTRP
jgi:hypothetical protein